MSVSFWDPHAHDSDLANQYYYPPEFETLYDELTIPTARLSDDATFNALPRFLRVSKARERWFWRYDTPEKYQRMTKRYYRAITGVDKGVQMIRDKLSELNIDDRTVIIYIGDNGYMINERQLAGKWFGWEECLRVPLIIHDPRTHALNGHEYVAGTHPKDAVSRYLVEQTVREGDEVRVSWDSVSNRIYVVQGTAALSMDPNWVSISEELVGDGERIEFGEPTSTSPPNAFYRVAVGLGP